MSSKGMYKATFNRTELTWFSFLLTDQWASSNVLGTV